MDNGAYLEKVYNDIFPPEREKVIIHILRNAGADGADHSAALGSMDSYRNKYAGSLSVSFRVDQHLIDACNRGELPFTPMELK